MIIKKYGKIVHKKGREMPEVVGFHFDANEHVVPRRLRGQLPASFCQMDIVKHCANRPELHVYE